MSDSTQWPDPSPAVPFGGQGVASPANAGIGQAAGEALYRPPLPRDAQSVANDARPGFAGEVWRPQPTDPGGTDSGGFMKVADYSTHPDIGVISDAYGGTAYFCPPVDPAGWKQT